jgi:2-keto-4-pentenoate hydratase
MNEESIAKAAETLLGAYASRLQPDFGHLLDTMFLPEGTAADFCAAIPFGPGDTVSAAFDRIGSVSITFSEKS